MFLLIGILFFPFKSVKIANFRCDEVVLIAFGNRVEGNAAKSHIISWMVAVYGLFDKIAGLLYELSLCLKITL